MRALLCSLTVLVWGAAALPALAQPPAPAPPKIWTVTVSAGLALTSGNTNTSTINAAYDIVYDPQTKNVVKSDGLFLRGETEDVLSAHRTSLNIRDEYSLTPRFFVFGQNQYLKDEFKNIEYLVAPTAGVGYKIFNTMATKLTVDGSAGVVWEKNPDVEVKLDVSAGQRQLQVPAVVGLTQALAQDAIEKTGLEVGDVTERESQAARGAVLEANPAAGTPVSPSTRVDLVISSGPPAVNAPDVVGQSYSAARAMLEQVGLQLGDVTTDSLATGISQTVISQTPAAGARVAPGTRVSLSIVP